MQYKYVFTAIQYLPLSKYSMRSLIIYFTGIFMKYPKIKQRDENYLFIFFFLNLKSIKLSFLIIVYLKRNNNLFSNGYILNI